MTARRPRPAHRREHIERVASVRAASSVGLTLGELRNLVHAAEGMDDNALLELEELDTSATHVGRYYARHAIVRDHVTVGDHVTAPVEAPDAPH